MVDQRVAGRPRPFAGARGESVRLDALALSPPRPVNFTLIVKDQRALALGLKAPAYFQAVTARLKSCPDTKPEFFRSL